MCIRDRRQVLPKPLPVDDIFETQAVWREALALGDIARMIVADGHGGIVLIVPATTGAWSKSLDPFPYLFARPDTTIRDAIRMQLNDIHAQGEIFTRLGTMPLPDDLKSRISLAMRPLSAEIGRHVRAIASLAGIDGAIVMTRKLELLGFGAKIAVDAARAPKVCMFRPTPGSQEVVQSALEDLGGTRHQSAARFADANHDTVALVISQDRHMSVVH